MESGGIISRLSLSIRPFRHRSHRRLVCIGLLHNLLYTDKGVESRLWILHFWICKSQTNRHGLFHELPKTSVVPFAVLNEIQDFASEKIMVLNNLITAGTTSHDNAIVSVVANWRNWTAKITKFLENHFAVTRWDTRFREQNHNRSFTWGIGTTRVLPWSILKVWLINDEVIDGFCHVVQVSVWTTVGSYFGDLLANFFQRLFSL